MGDGKITEKNVSSIDTTTDLLCTPGKYTNWDYKNHNIMTTWNNVWGGLTDIPREIFGVGLNGILLFQALTDEGQDPWSPVKGIKEYSDECGTTSGLYYNQKDNGKGNKQRYLGSKVLPGCLFSNEQSDDKKLPCTDSC